MVGPGKPGLIFVTGTGDDGGVPNHAAGMIPAGGKIELSLLKTSRDKENLGLDLWYSDQDHIEIALQTPSGRYGPQKHLSIGAGQSITLRDVLNSVFGLEAGYGAIRIESDSRRLAMISQTSTPGGGGTFGQSVPVAALGDRIVFRQPRSIAGIREDDSFRTNLILTNATDIAVDVDIKLKSSTGSMLAVGRYGLPPSGMTQVTQVVRQLGIDGDVTNAQLELSTPTLKGSFVTYASLIDNVTNDPSTLLARPTGGSSAELIWMLPSSARVAGEGGAFYTTDFTVSNTGDREARYSLKFLGNNVDGRQGLEKTFVIGPGQSAVHSDLLQSVFEIPSGFGALQLATNSPALIVAGQTSTPAESGGRFGQSVPGFSVGDLIESGFAKSILAVREDSQFRTNLVLANATEEGLDVDVSLIADDGSTLGSKRYRLPSLGMTQISRVVRDLGISQDVVSARLLLSTPTLKGLFAAYASAIDNVTNDPRTLLPR